MAGVGATAAVEGGSGTGAGSTQRPLDRRAEVRPEPLATAKEVCGREVIRALPGGRSVLARESSGRLVVLKPLPRDCLRQGELLPLVRDRLLRIRELADVQVANFHGAEEDARCGPVQIWEWVEGADLSASPSSDLLDTARLLVGAVEKIHQLGIVHGALHLRNVIVATGITGRRGLTLTHLSPLVVDEPRKDSADLIRMLRELNARPLPGHATAGQDAKLSRVLAESGLTPELGDLREALLLAKGSPFVQGRDPQGKPRPRSVWLAISLLCMGAAASCLFAWLALRGAE